MRERRLEDQCWCRSHTDRTAPGAARLRSAERQQLQLFESILNRIPKLVRECLQPLLRSAVVEVQGAETPQDRLHPVKARRLGPGHPNRPAPTTTTAPSL